MCHNITYIFFENVRVLFCACTMRMQLPIITKRGKNYTYGQYQPRSTQSSLAEDHCPQNSSRQYYRRAHDVSKTQKVICSQTIFLAKIQEGIHSSDCNWE